MALETTLPRNTVAVACKLPHGLILELEGSKMEAPTPGAREVKVYYPIGEKYTINGSLSAHLESNRNGRVVAGYGITEVPADFWDKWVEQKKGFPPLINGTLFALPKTADAEREAAKLTSVRTGLEPLDPAKPAPGIVPATNT